MHSFAATLSGKRGEKGVQGRRTSHQNHFLLIAVWPMKSGGHMFLPWTGTRPAQGFHLTSHGALLDACRSCVCKEEHDRHSTACTGKGLQEQQSSSLTPRALLQVIDTMLSREFTMLSVTNTANKNCPTATSQTSENGSVLQCHQINKLILNLDFFF